LLSDAAVVTAAMVELPVPSSQQPGGEAGRSGSETRDPLGDLSAGQLLAVLGEVGGNLSRAAARLGVPRNTLRYRLAKLGAEVEDSCVKKRGGAGSSASKELAPPRGSEPAAIRPASRLAALLRVEVMSTEAADSLSAQNRVVEVIAGKIRGFGGRMVSQKDRAMIGMFVTPALEDAAVRGAHAATAIRKAGLHPPDADLGFAIVASIHLGPCEQDSVSGEVGVVPEELGRLTPVLAALTQGVEAGTIAVSQAAARWLERRFALQPLDLGRGHAERAYRLDLPAGSAAVVEGRPLSPFVGRRRQLQALQDLLGQVRRGAGQVVGLVGEAGIGKSRLIREFRHGLSRAEAHVLEGRCASYGGGAPYLPICELLRQHCGLDEMDPPEAIESKVRRRLGEDGLEPERWAPYVLNLLGVKEGTSAVAPLTPEAVKTGRSTSSRKSVSRRASGARW
jgi:hypothetical protein